MAKDNKYEKDTDQKEVMRLDDDQRIKVLSPSMLVFKRFVRNRLAITGSIFIFAMFLFSYLGGFLMPYGEDEVFTKYDEMYKVFAGVSENEKLKYVVAEGEKFPLIDQSQFVLAANNGERFFEAAGNSYLQEQIDEEYSTILKLEEVGLATVIGKDVNFTSTDSDLGSDFSELALSVVENQETNFEFKGQSYYAIHSKKNSVFYRANDLAVVTKNIYSYASKDGENNYTFVKAVEDSIRDGNKSFTVDGVDYDILDNDGDYEIILGSEIYATVSRFQMEAIYEDVFLDLEFRNVIKDAIDNGQDSFTYADKDGQEIYYRLSRQNLQWTIERIESTYLIDKYSFPSAEHLLGTDGNGMDLLTRIMFGGRISLRIGFIVVIIETFIGIVLGGIAGYFGKFWDNLIMRIVDIFNCIPSLPLIIILGAVMDQLRIDPLVRLNILMLILAVLGWPGIARMVRGQTLSLREQEFMTATEAVGLHVYKRIFKHLIPNIIPQLIVICTLSLGGVILTESTLSFLGVGVKFPFASWGNIINAVSNVHVMSNYLFVWIPAGMCILITVLGFNFIGDGLRDAFDPKMKR